MKLSYLAVLLLASSCVWNSVNAQCLTTSSPNNDCSWGDAINSITINSISANNTGCNSYYYGYSSFNNPVWNLTAGSTYAMSANVGTSSYQQGLAIWIDLNNNGQYEASEMVFTSASPANNHSGNITIPSTASVGTSRRMRVMCAWGVSITSSQACTSFLGLYGGYGETEDYYVNILSSCAATVTTQAKDTAICAGANASFTIAGTSINTYQWQVSTNNGTSWSAVTNGGVYSGATTATLLITGAPATMNTYQYRCVATNTAGSCSVNSDSKLLTVNALPTITATTPNSACTGASTSVSATASSGATVSWYDALVGGTLLGSNNTLNIASAPGVSTTYYAQANSASAVADSISHGLYATNNNTGAFFDIIPQTNMQLTDVTWRPTTTTNYTVDVYFKAGTAVGSESTSGAWTLIGSTGSYNATANVDHKITLSSPQNLVSGTRYALFVVRTSGTGYIYYHTATTPGAGNVWVQDADIQVITGNGASGLFTGVSNASRMFDGILWFTKGGATSCVSSPRTPVQLTVNPPLNITTQPSNTTACENSNTTISVASSNATTYRWELSTNGGGLWNTITNGGVYSGANTNTLSITGALLSMNTYQYRVVCTTACSQVGTSSIATLTVNPAATITSNPTNKTVCPGGSTTFASTATGFGTITYQWQVSNNGGSTWANITNGGNYSNATTSTLTVSSITNAMNTYQYRCIAMGTCSPSATSTAATLTVNTIPAVTSNPSSLTYCTGAGIAFSCSGTGTNLAYQWTVSTNGGVSFTNVTNGGVYSGATTATLNITGATAGMNGYRYRCVISGTCTPSVTTSSATMTLGALPMVTTQPLNNTICTGTTKSIALSATGYNITYQWQESTNGGGIWNNVTNGGVYSGATTNALTFTNATIGMTGYMYRCIVTNGCAQTATSNAITLTVSNPAVVTMHPANAATCQGGTVQYIATGTSSGPITYQWQGSMNGTTWNNLANTGAHSGVNTTTLTISGIGIPNTFKMYRCEMSTGCVPATVSNSATLTINDAPSITANPLNKTICGNGNTSFTVGANGTGITFQWQLSTNGGTTWNNVADGGVYSGATTFNLVLTNVPTSYNSYRYRCIVSGTCPAPLTSTAGILTVNTNVAITSNPTASTTFCSGGSTSFSVGSVGTGRTYKWYTYTGTGWAQVTNGGNYSGATTSTLNITNMTATANTKTLLYYCTVTGTCNVQSSTVCTLTVHAKPAITANPVNVTRCHGFGNIDFKVTANGTNIAYQWQLSTNGGSTWANLTNNSLYSGVNTSILSVDVATNPMNGYRYRCVVSGTCTPAVTSGTATLTVNPLLEPAVSIAASNTDICAGNSVTFTPTPTNGGSAPVYQWRKNNTPVATGSSYTTTTLAHGDIITCHMTSNVACATPAVVISNPITMKVTPYSTTTITIGSDVGNSWCTGKPLEFTANVTNGGDNPTYKWLVNGVDQMVNAPNLPLPSISNNSTVKCEVVSSMKCFTPNPAVSNTITMTINQTTKSSIVIAPNPDSVICEKTEVTMFASFTNAGSTPKFQWMMNGSDIPGETMGTLKTTGISNGDVINCRLISSNTCVFPEVSNPVTFQVDDLLSPDVDLITTYNGNNSYTFTAVPTNGGSNPVFVWYRNFKPLPGVTGDTYTVGDLERWERIHVDMASNEPCIDPLLTTVSSKIVTTSVGELAENISDLTLHPNPNTGAFNISGKLDAKVAGKDVQIRITNALGQTIHTVTQRAGSTQLNIPVTLGDNIANGVYTVNLSVDGKSANIRFVLNR